ncbi:MAG: hypothetical protein ACTSUE_02670 [Promethearchaeota archaeon]
MALQKILVKYNWLFMLVAAVLGASALVFPVAGRPEGAGRIVFWMWALNMDTSVSPADIWFNDSTLAVAGAVLESACTVVAVVILVLVMTRFLKKEMKEERAVHLLLVPAILLLVVPIGYSIGGLAWSDTFWTDYHAGFGFIAPFIASGLVWFYYVTVLILKKE